MAAKKYKRNPKLITQQRVKEVAHDIAHGLKRHEIIERWAEKWKVKAPTIDRYMRLAKQHAKSLSSVREEARVEAFKEQIKHEEELRLLDRAEKRILLSKIARGEIEIKTKKPVFDPMQKRFVMLPVEAPPDYSDRLRAMDMDNKMEGDYAPDRRVVTNKQDLDYSKMSTEELQFLKDIQQRCSTEDTTGS